MPKLHGSNRFLGWRIQTPSVDHCPFREALWMSHAGTLGTKCVSKAAKANENWPWTQIPSEEQWQTWQKGKNLTHVGFHWGTGSFMKKHTHWEAAVTIWNITHWTYDTVALNCRHLQLGVISHHWLIFHSNCFFSSVSLFYLSVISSSLKACFSLSLLCSPSLHLLWRGHCS